jgi:hypothetical protein
MSSALFIAPPFRLVLPLLPQGEKDRVRVKKVDGFEYIAPHF